MKEITNQQATNTYPVCPQVAVGAIVFNGEKVLLVKRGQPPMQGVWAIPGGRVELGETLHQAAEREILEETGLTIKAHDPIYTFDVIERDDKDQVRFHYVIVDLPADYISGEISPGDDALDARWVSRQEAKELNVSRPTLKLLKQLFGF